MYFISVALCLLYAVTPLVPQNQGDRSGIGVKEIGKIMAEGSWEQRDDVVKRVREMDVMAKSAEVRRIMAGELVRMNALRADWAEKAARGTPDPAAVDTSEYYATLLEICSKTNDPVVIDGLLGALGTGGMVSGALARFGSMSLPRLIDVVDDEEPSGKVMDALMAMEKMLSSGTVDANGRTRILSVARSEMGRRHTDIMWAAVFFLAVSTGDPELRGSVDRVANGTARVPIAAERSDSATQVRKFAQAALKRVPDTR